MGRHLYVTLIVTWLTICFISGEFGLSGHVCTVYCTGARQTSIKSGLWGWSRTVVVRYFQESCQRCCYGWKDNGYENCIIPICTTPCYSGGTCIGPDTCECPSSHQGPNCDVLSCSHLSPCYPGACSPPNHCDCTDGFSGTGCLNYNNSPNITACEVTLTNIRRLDGKQLFHFNIPCSPGLTKDIIWCNQELFNYAEFSMESFNQQLQNLPKQPDYVTNSGFGIVSSGIHVIHSKIHRNVTLGRFISLDKRYPCTNGASSTKPDLSSSFCTIIEPNYEINIEHGDWLYVSYNTTSGGFRTLIDVDTDQTYATDVYTGQSVNKEVEFRFDFIAPDHCSGTNKRCTGEDSPIHLDKDITQEPISLRWEGWSDDLSGLSYYYLEIFKLEPDKNADLTELYPLSPIYNYTTTNITDPGFLKYTPTSIGMYSILLQASDNANNSKIARRLVLFDNLSNITLTKPGFTLEEGGHVTVQGDGGMHVTSAIPETGYMWQTSRNGSKIHIILNWEKHFVNKYHEDGKLLNKVLPYPTQFQDLSDEGVLRSEKFVALDDTDGQRTVDAISNMHGIVKFEVNKVYTDDRQIPKYGWNDIPLAEQYETDEVMNDGSHLRIWIRATDIMNNTVADYREVHIDNTPPIYSNVKLRTNVDNGTYTYTSRITFTAADSDSGVHKIGYAIELANDTDTKKEGFVTAHGNNASSACATDPVCQCVLGECFLAEQTLDIDNCWFIVPKEDLNKSGNVIVTIYNQAMLYKEFPINMGMLRTLQGLEEYSGPTNIRIEKTLSNSVRLAWDLPKTASCYGRADIDIVLHLPDGSKYVRRVVEDETSVDLVGLASDQDYNVYIMLGYQGTSLATLPYTFRTAPLMNYLDSGVITGVVTGVMALFGLMIVIFIVMLRRGHMQPVRRRLHALSVYYRKSMAEYRRSATYTKTDADSIYVYGGMDFSEVQDWHMSRDSINIELLLKTGSFALIYKATLRTSSNEANSIVVAKTLKEGFTAEDELLMHAKINFTAIEVGHHENVLRFIGAVIKDSDVGPFIVYEYCEHGSLKDYMASHRSDLTIELQENLFRFGLGVARGMEYLADKKIVHRRLAARNILLDCRLNVKVAGIGPQPGPDDDDDTDASSKTEKRERIPIKWTAPECFKSTVNATEKSDMWSYGVVLWEIFSLGETPYGNVSSLDLPAKLKKGIRLQKPEQCDEQWFDLMQRAWNISPNKRPTFTEVRGELDKMFVAAPVDDYCYYE